MLQKDEVGRTRHPIGILPGHDHAYGRPEHRDVEDARQVIKSWKVHQESRETQMPPDFTKLNKFAMSNKDVKIKVSISGHDVNYLSNLIFCRICNSTLNSSSRGLRCSRGSD